VQSVSWNVGADLLALKPLFIGVIIQKDMGLLESPVSNTTTMTSISWSSSTIRDSFSEPPLNTLLIS
jgi:hypothetical protein